MIPKWIYIMWIIALSINIITKIPDFIHISKLFFSGNISNVSSDILFNMFIALILIDYCYNQLFKKNI